MENDRSPLGAIAHSCYLRYPFTFIQTFFYFVGTASCAEDLVPHPHLHRVATLEAEIEITLLTLVISL
jgi:hypothetical protein